MTLLRVSQQEDVVMFAKLVMSLATNNPSAVQYVHKSMEIVGRHYSNDLVQVIHTLMKPIAPMKVRVNPFANFVRWRLMWNDRRFKDSSKLSETSSCWRWMHR